MAEARTPEHDHQADRRFWTGLARAFGGAIFFSMPLLMTMEMWWLGFYLSPVRIGLFLAVTIPLLIGLSHYVGFEPTETWADDVIDAAVALGVGFVASTATLALLNIINLEMTASEILGKILLQTIPGSLGAILAASQMGGRGSGQEKEERKRRAGYWPEVFFMAGGALFFAFNVAPTEEMVLIAYKMTYGHGLALGIATLVLMHAFVYGVEFGGTPAAPKGTPWWSLFFRFTVVGYAIALVLSAYVLWTFGRFEAHPLPAYVLMAVTLGFPAGLGASAARLIL